MAQGYFAFRFTCQECYWSVDTTPIRSTVSIATDVMDIGVGFLPAIDVSRCVKLQYIYGNRKIFIFLQPR